MGRTTPILLLLMGSAAWADPTSAVFAPESFRESITPQNLQAMGLDPSNFEVTVPLHPGLTVSQKTVTAGAKGFLSTGTAERYTTDVNYAFSSTGSLRLFRDAATVASPFGAQRSSVIRVNLDQGFGQGLWAGKVSFAHEDVSNSATSDGRSSSRSDTINLSMGLGKSSSLAASASFAQSLTQVETKTEKQDVVLTSAATAVAEYHHSKVETAGVPVETTQIALRTPTLKLADVGTVSVSHVQNQSSLTGTDRTESVNFATTVAQLQLAATFMSADRPTGPESVTTVNVSAKPSPKVDLTASLFDASRPTGDESLHSMAIVARPTEALTLSASQTSTVKPGVPDITTTVVTSNLKVSDQVAVAANLNSTKVEGTGTTTVTSVDVAKAPPDGMGLAIKAGVIDTKTPATKVDPTVHVQLDYKTKDALALSGSYHNAPGLAASEVLSSLALPLWGGALSANWGQRTTTPNVAPSQGLGVVYVRPVGWGLTGSLGYDSVTNLVGPPLSAWGVKAAVTGENPTLGKLDLQLNSGRVRDPLGGVSEGLGVAFSLARPVEDLGNLSLSLKHTGWRVLPDDNQIRLDASFAW